MEWTEKEVLVLVKAYPHPSSKYGETVCTAGITKEGEWIRLYPVTFRDLPDDKQYKKWQWIKVEVKPSDERLRRPESHKINPDTVQIIGYIPSDNRRHKAERERNFMPMVSPHLECLMEQRDKKELSLGAFQPAEVTDFVIEKGDSDWSEKQLECLSRQDLFDSTPKNVLQKIPYTFKYKFKCANPDCKGHNMSIIDWEVNEAYRNFKRTYKDEEETLKQLKYKYLTYFWKERESYFVVGTTSDFNRFVILTVYSPRKKTDQLSLF